MESQEIKHSNFIAWLLDPRESHRLCDSLVKGMLSTAYVANVNEPTATGPSIADVILDDLTSSQVVRESEGDICILFRTDRNDGLVLSIEKKVWAGLSDEQLDKYQRYVSMRYSNHKNLIFMLLRLAVARQDVPGPLQLRQAAQRLWGTPADVT